MYYHVEREREEREQSSVCDRPCACRSRACASEKSEHATDYRSKILIVIRKIYGIGKKNKYEHCSNIDLSTIMFTMQHRSNCKT
jgi:hypothetical protein